MARRDRDGCCWAPSNRVDPTPLRSVNAASQTGAGMFGKSVEAVFVDDDPAEMKRSVGFSPDIFKGQEFLTLKIFCNRRAIHQRHLNALFNTFIPAEHAYLREFRVRTLDCKERYSDKTKLNQEIAEILIPTIFMKQFRGLQEGHSMEEVTFPRFLIMSFIFCAQPMPDLIFDFISILRQRFDLKLNAIMFAYNFEQMVHVLMEELKPSATKSHLSNLLFKLRKEEEMTVDEVILMGIKYPLLFYALKRFRQYFRRMVCGDKFWEQRKMLKSRFASEIVLKKGYAAEFVNEDAAKRATARALLRDVVYHAENEYHLRLTDSFYTPWTSISDEDCTTLKEVLGYKLARSLILESEFSYPSVGQDFINPAFISEGPGEERITDHKSRQDFYYDVATGKRSWIQKYVSHDGADTVLAEREHGTVSHLAYEQATTEDGTV